ncbi:MAG: 16S rRNA (cytidine(1402)-2'-O)-methyltransferase [Myxococcota bacterium]|nr:16S rRNA (cytidine(1402)-2'-O)-methyltransferase [Myxococcota bacterium]
MLTLISTPIGNLQDLSPRAQQALKESDIVLCEDTRRTLGLFRAFGLSIPKLVNLHGHNELSKVPQVISQLKSGLKIALVSDAGTPLISDPGQGLVQAVHAAGITVTAIPGPSAFVMALSVSGFQAPFQFLGFPPRKTGQLHEFLIRHSVFPGTSVLYEAGNRCAALLKKLVELFPQREACLCRELTKQYEEIRRGPLSDWPIEDYRGEVVLVLGPGQPVSKAQEDAKKLKDVAKQLGKLWNIRASDAYDKLLEIRPE